MQLCITNKPKIKSEFHNFLVFISSITIHSLDSFQDEISELALTQSVPLRGGGPIQVLLQMLLYNFFEYLSKRFDLRAIIYNGSG